MVAGRTVWRTGSERVLWADLDDLRLEVRGPERAGGPARFLVLREVTGRRTLVGSGSEAEVRAAMAAAERTAARQLGRG